MVLEVYILNYLYIFSCILLQLIILSITCSSEHAGQKCIRKALSRHMRCTFSKELLKTLANKILLFCVTGMKTVNLHVFGCADNENDMESARLALFLKLL